MYRKIVQLTQVHHPRKEERGIKYSPQEMYSRVVPERACLLFADDFPLMSGLVKARTFYSAFVDKIGCH